MKVNNANIDEIPEEKIKFELARLTQEMIIERGKRATLEEEKKNIIFHVDYKFFIESLTEKGYKKTGEFIQGNSLFEVYLNTHALVFLQMDVQGRTIIIFRQINFSMPNDVLNELDRLDNRPKVLHTKTPTKVTWLTRLADWLLKVNKIFN